MRKISPAAVLLALSGIAIVALYLSLGGELSEEKKDTLVPGSLPVAAQESPPSTTPVCGKVLLVEIVPVGHELGVFGAVDIPCIGDAESVSQVQKAGPAQPRLVPSVTPSLRDQECKVFPMDIVIPLAPKPVLKTIAVNPCDEVR